jgi:hypothetical protein
VHNPVISEERAVGDQVLNNAEPVYGWPVGTSRQQRPGTAFHPERRCPQIPRSAEISRLASARDEPGASRKSGGRPSRGPLS